MKRGNIVLVHADQSERFATVRTVEVNTVEVVFITGLIKTVDQSNVTLWNQDQTKEHRREVRK